MVADTPALALVVVVVVVVAAVIFVMADPIVGVTLLPSLATPKPFGVAPFACMPAGNTCVWPGSVNTVLDVETEVAACVCVGKVESAEPPVASTA